MKNVFRTNVWSFAIAKLQAKMRSILAIIAIVAVIGFSFAACEDKSDDDNNNNNSKKAKLTIVNNYAKPITKVRIPGLIEEGNLSITTTQSFDIDFLPISIYLYAEGLNGTYGYSYESAGSLLQGKTTTYTLNAGGTITCTLP